MISAGERSAWMSAVNAAAAPPTENCGETESPRRPAGNRRWRSASVRLRPATSTADRATRAVNRHTQTLEQTNSSPGTAGLSSVSMNHLAVAAGAPVRRPGIRARPATAWQGAQSHADVQIRTHPGVGVVAAALSAWLLVAANAAASARHYFSGAGRGCRRSPGNVGNGATCSSAQPVIQHDASKHPQNRMRLLAKKRQSWHWRSRSRIMRHWSITSTPAAASWQNQPTPFGLAAHCAHQRRGAVASHDGGDIVAAKGDGRGADAWIFRSSAVHYGGAGGVVATVQHTDWPAASARRWLALLSLSARRQRPSGRQNQKQCPDARGMAKKRLVMGNWRHPALAG